jgi:hypothetical protein
MVKRVLILAAGFLAAKARFLLILLLLALATVVLFMVHSGAGWLSLGLVGFMGLMLIALFWALVRFWLGVLAEMVKPDA